MDTSGAYTADRAAALSGVPRSTVHYWARHEILVPSVSRERVRLWSYSDLFALRTVYWLRARKTTASGYEVPATAMRLVRRALAHLRELDLALFHDGRPTVLVQADGTILVEPPGERPHTLQRQTVDSDVLDVVRPFDTVERTRGVDLYQPAKLVRILPRKLSGAPHVVETRIDTEGLARLAQRGFTVDAIVALYADLDAAKVEQALELEERLRSNLANAA